MQGTPLNTSSSPFTFSTMGASTSGPNLGASTYTMNNPNYHAAPGYQSGYLSTSLLSPSNPSSQNNTQVQADANDTSTTTGPPIVPTKAKMNHLFASGPASGKAGDFGLSSRLGMSSRQRDYQMDDEDAPPTMSINDEDITMGAQPLSPDSLRQSSGPGWFTGEYSHKKSANAQRAQTYTYVIVFGYPPSKYTQTVSHFQSLCSNVNRDDGNEPPAVTAAEPLDIINAFKIGYLDPSDAMRAVRKNGEIIGGEWMIGARYADSNQQPQTQSPPPVQQLQSPQTQQNNMAASTSERQRMNTSLMPSSTAFRTPVKAGGHQQHVTPSHPSNLPMMPQADVSPTKKGMFGQVSDMIFGW